MQHHFNQVALAETTPAEGYAMGGLAGLILSCLLVGVIAGLAVRVLARRRSSLQFSCLAAGALVTSPAFVERGLLGVWATLINFMQVSIVLVFVGLLLSGLAQKGLGGGHRRPLTSPGLDERLERGRAWG
jgi:asparagine N-glycosylation enzyme membrane subunit Stt3